ncbi:metalloregulator ArsR/SmtB family transcription factor [Corynebacterium sp.]|uniref:ArsR/SmtB family transcription factor n=1 Tax=Corynebacterium sp. TaxID=1720 RepID=UPI0025B9DBD3|nr:metalloregulator ArsR/SmtB family transcription factor [Corynebacterium sp.]
MSTPRPLPDTDVLDVRQCCSLGTGPLTQDESVRYAGLFKVLAEPVRLRMLSQLAAAGCGPVSVGELTEMMGLSQPTVSHHLKMMTEAGLLERHREGRSVIHQVCPEVFTQLRTVLQIG